MHLGRRSQIRTIQHFSCAGDSAASSRYSVPGNTRARYLARVLDLSGVRDGRSDHPPSSFSTRPDLNTTDRRASVSITPHPHYLLTTYYIQSLLRHILPFLPSASTTGIQDPRPVHITHRSPHSPHSHHIHTTLTSPTSLTTPPHPMYPSHHVPPSSHS